MVSQTSERALRWVLRAVHDLAPESYLVGGAVRDVLMGLPRSGDLDLALKGDAFQVARRVAELVGPACTFVPLDLERGTARLVLKEPGNPFVDVSSFKGATIFEDLGRRDFTVNAIAVSIPDFLSEEWGSVIDPCNGVKDLERKTVRACSAESFQEDPLRILRAFRFSSSLGFVVSPGTMDLLRASMPDLASVSGERIRDELMIILALRSAWPVLDQMDRIGLLETLFPEFHDMRGCVQNEYHHLDVWGHSLEAIRVMDGFFSSDSTCPPSFLDIVQPYALSEPVPGRPRLSLLRLAALFHDSGKPRARFVDDGGRIRFFGHELVSVEIFQASAARLKLAQREIHMVSQWIEGHMRPILLLNQPASRRALFRLQRAFTEELLGLFILFLADLGATRGPARPQGLDDKVYEQVCEAMATASEVQEKAAKPLVNGWDVMKALGLAPGPKVGEILDHIAELTAAGEVTTPEEAIEAAKRLV